MQFLKRLAPRPKSRGILQYSTNVAAEGQPALVDWLVHGCNIKSDAWGVAGKWREVVLGGTSNDFDVGVYAPLGRESESLIACLMATTAQCKPVNFSRTHWDVTLHTGQQVDLVFHETPILPSDMLDAAHIGISAIATDLFTGKTWVDEDFIIDSDRQEIRLRRVVSPSQAGKMVGKLQEKYPHFVPRYNNKVLV